MSENIVPNIGRVELDPAKSLDQTGSAQLLQSATSRSRLPDMQSGVQGKVEAKGDGEVKFEKAPSNPAMDISLKFKIDEETNAVTILILDKASRQVVRTIPPEDMTKMEPGELLELFT